MVDSPCKQVCQFFTGTQVCRGCGRLSKEIQSWMLYDDKEKTAVVERAERRLAQIITQKPQLR